MICLKVEQSFFHTAELALILFGVQMVPNCLKKISIFRWDAENVCRGNQNQAAYILRKFSGIQSFKKRAERVCNN